MSSFDEPVTRPSASPSLPRYDPRDALWYVSTDVHGKGAIVVGHDSTDPRNPALEDALEAARPKDAVSRRACVIVTDQPQLLQVELRDRPGARLYRVEVPANARTSGRFDRQLLGMNPPASFASDYWARWCNTKRAIRTEVLATEVVVVAELPAAFTAAVRALGRDLTPSELMSGALSF